MDHAEDFFWRKSTEYHSYYHMKIFGYVDVACCVIVLISNAFLIMVFARKGMNSPPNTILTHMAITESLAAICYAPRTWHEYFRVEICSIPQHRTYIWEMISWHSYLASFIFRHTGVWIAVMLAIWRYIAVIHPLKERDWCNLRITRICMVVGYIVMVLAVIPIYLCAGVGPAVKLLDQNGCSTSNYTIGQNITTYEFQVPIEKYPVLYTVTIMIYGLFIKILPSIVLIVISYKLIVSLIKVEEHRKEMVTTSQQSNTQNSKTKRKMEKPADRTTIILLVLLILFVIGEVPHGIFCMFTAFLGPKFFWKYYYFAMEIFNCLTHISESFNFVIYYAMSFQFRNTFKALFDKSSNTGKMVISQGSSSSLTLTNKVQDKSYRPLSITTISSNCG